ncbi:hypothetical protein H6G80_21065 [Nostoc sp. FACHB-87]|uniref:hypothetical protein n=1 Tax=Nostocales TaxID=1161 RepID=UPI001682FBDA|nr:MULTISPECIES: hypothetical protein [Nostocales]MBD2300186.1 hypothetical protein [Nostoc sp. FACHB-190]MBD2456556.1 hypothetical protein [Nostoc sp. FACHB-87]MBD2477207.1 hypothetical protein [Anabaena sp. FACHB-83]MBD2485976.1 hypothetical protein [Aulosira sp. FACHB-615]
MSDRPSIYISVDSQSEIAIKKIVDKIISSGKLSRQDHTLLLSQVFANGQINDRVRRQINRILDQIQTGQLKLIDW